MTAESGAARFDLARRLLAVKEAIADGMSEEFFTVHPEFLSQFGEHGRQHCTADARFHVESLAGAIQSGSPEAFAEYARWAARVLAARGIEAHTLEENFDQLENQIGATLEDQDRRVVSRFLSSGRRACTEPMPREETRVAQGPAGLAQQVFLAAILAGERSLALTIVETALGEGIPQVGIYVDVISESLRSVGAMWEANLIGVAQEHMATAIAQYVIAMIYPRLTAHGPRRGTMVVTGVCGEQHQIGANLVADAMEAKGWDVRFLGTNVPHTAVVNAVGDSAADVLCISTTLVANLPSAMELIRAVRTKLGKQAPAIVLGGAAYRMTPGFAANLERTQVITDLRQALAVLCA